MPRPLRPIADGLIYHVINRGNNRQTVFESDGDYLAFLKAIADLKERKPFDLYGYCLMGNHIHLLIRPREVLDQSHRAEPAGVAHAALPPLPSIERACLAGTIQEPRDSRRRPPPDGVAVHRSQPLAGEDGGARGRLSLEQLRLSWPGAERRLARSGGGLRCLGELSGGAAAALVGLRASDARGGRVGGHSSQQRDGLALRRDGRGSIAYAGN